MNDVERVIKEIVKVLVKEYNPEKIILFGSYAYGNPNEESDIDLFIVKDTNESFYKRLLKIRKIVSSIRHGYPFEPLVMTPKELKKRISIGDHFFEEILDKGKVLYG